jgi:hypothetical protein
MNQELRQRCPFSPVLFNLYLRDVISEQQADKPLPPKLVSLQKLLHQLPKTASLDIHDYLHS